MPSYEEDYKAIENARKTAGALVTDAGSLDASANMFKDDVMANVRNARAERGISTLGQDYANTTRELATYGPDSRARMGTDVNPLAADAITARERGDILGRLSGISTAMTEQTGTIDEIIGSGTNRLKAMATLKQAEADKAKEDADVMMKMVQIKQEEDQRQFERTMRQKEIDIAASRATQDAKDKEVVFNNVDDKGNTVTYSYDQSTGVVKVLAGGTKQPAGATINAMAKQGMKWDPNTNAFVKDVPWWQKPLDSLLGLNREVSLPEAEFAVQVDSTKPEDYSDIELKPGQMLVKDNETGMVGRIEQWEYEPSKHQVIRKG